MKSFNWNTHELAREVTQQIVGRGMPPMLARLYSQYSRLKNGRTGLSKWTHTDDSRYLNQAIQLIQAAFFLKDEDDKDWRQGLVRAAEMLEWLSFSNLKESGFPTRLMSAATYQIAGYPARARGLLSEVNDDDTQSEAIKCLLKVDFPRLIETISKYWKERALESQPVESSIGLRNWVIDETFRALGILASDMRWGNELRVSKALNKLEALSKVLALGNDPHSWLLAKLCSEVARCYFNSAMRGNLQEVCANLNESGRSAIERYIRYNYLNCRSLVWTSQIRGIQSLIKQESFALCTPTGSGKTAVAELAIIQSLFSDNPSLKKIEEVTLFPVAPLAIYFTPSRALATEVEIKLSGVFNRLSDQKVVVTGLYGGTDWGPTDAWVSREDPTVLICTYEKGEALLRFMGTNFLHRVSLIIIDEAHSVQFNGSGDNLKNDESRALRLESLISRMLVLVNPDCKVIALSAVSVGVDRALSQWVTGETSALPINETYRSTRQLIGRLECLPHRSFEIRYDILDGAFLKYKEDGKIGSPYIPNLIPPCPPALWIEREGPEKKLRPYLFWAGIHLASPGLKAKHGAVLISVTQGPTGYAKDLLELLENTWANEELPSFFKEPTELDQRKLWNKCLDSCQDYFGVNSYEYKLLQKGVVIHHGKMPGLFARLLIEVIQARIVHLVIATSTLSEGVNLPFEVVLIPTLRRGKGQLSIREFKNLAGRAGRPGFATEGQTLVMLDDFSVEFSARKARDNYLTLINQLAIENPTDEVNKPISALAELLVYLQSRWNQVVDDKLIEFEQWLEETAPLDLLPVLMELNEENKLQVELLEVLDTVDGILVSVIAEVEKISGRVLTIAEVEEHLAVVWKKSYAHCAAKEEELLKLIFITRGKALAEIIYPDESRRKQMYLTSLPPRHGVELLAASQSILDVVRTGTEYALWDLGTRMSFIRDLIELISSLRRFRLIKAPGGKKVSWEDILYWWLSPETAVLQPDAGKVANWHGYINSEFSYKFNWGFSSFLSTTIPENDGQLEQQVDRWTETGLPWITFWLKELMIWGTTDPVVAYLMGRKLVFTRTEASNIAKEYYSQKIEELTADELLDANRIRKWSEDYFTKVPTKRRKLIKKIKVQLLRDFSNVEGTTYRVIPIIMENDIHWIDPAGYTLAVSTIIEGVEENSALKDYVLDPEQMVIRSSRY